VRELKQAILGSPFNRLNRYMRRRCVGTLILLTALCTTGVRAEAPVSSSAPLSSSAIATSSSNLSLDAGLELADTVVVRKSERRLYLMRRGAVLKSFKVALGLRPEGHKQFEGDYRTPEGKYVLNRRNPNSEYFLSIQVSYPNDDDVARARKQGQRPGGAIMIHGQPNLPTRSRDYYATVDWTEGCIAVSNSDMVEIWLMTPPDTPIEIRP
jgi:murein L,D-transpeptidase YafK